MTPQEFIAKWRHVELKERSASQSHFNDLCRLLGVDDPITADPLGDWFTFEKGASKTGGGEGWADVWRRECFAWEYKGRRKDLDAAFAQLQRYAIALDNPPLLIVSDMDRIRIHTNWTNTVQKVHVLTLDDLADAAKRDLLRACFLNPEALKPGQTRQALTEEAASRFAGLAQRLRGRGHDAQAVAHFVNRLVFCMFAEDVRLLPDTMFDKMIRAARPNPETFATHARTLFAAMRTGGLVGFERVEWFNGGLFDDDEALPLSWEDIDDLIRAAQLDWSGIDPSILGTLFERGLDPGKRSQLGAHYTDRDKIMMIVTPVIVAPLMAEWAGIRSRIESLLASAPKPAADRLPSPADRAAATRAAREAEALHRGFLDRLRAFRVLDPACGSGNFLYLSLLALKDIEHRVNLEAEDMGLPRPLLLGVGPENLLGIELNPYAAELARVSVWIGEIQWMRRNGYEAAKNPILRTLDTIECRDAVLAPEGKRADWPVADVVVGNPPFLGDRKMIRELGEDYTVALRRAYPEVPGGVDLVCYWFAKAWAQMQAGNPIRAGLVATNSIRGGANRAVLKAIVERGRIFEAWSDEEWTVDGAAVRVSLVCFESAGARKSTLNGETVGEILPDLTANDSGVNLTSANRLIANSASSFIGTQKNGSFDIPGREARNMLLQPLNPNGRPNSDVLMPWTNGSDIVKRDSDTWVIDFGATMSEQDAALYEAPFRHVVIYVQPTRLHLRRDWHRTKWWLHGDPRPAMKREVAKLHRLIVTPRVSKHRVFVWRNCKVVPDSAVVAIARDDDTTFGILHSRFHELWSLRMGTSLEDRPRYTPSTTFETFPFPEGLTPNIPAADYADDPRAQAIAAAAIDLNTKRELWLNPPDRVRRVPEVVPGYPDRILPVDEEAAKILKTRTLTNLYNQRPAWLDHAHRALDRAVAEAYGWGGDWSAGMGDDEILARLFRLNQQRAGAALDNAGGIGD
jgi:type II restriction/modification system DNA methylase subunit YeeA